MCFELSCSALSVGIIFGAFVQCFVDRYCLLRCFYWSEIFILFSRLLLLSVATDFASSLELSCSTSSIGIVFGVTSTGVRALPSSP